MRMEELADSMYIKQTDAVEKYLLNLVQEYFKSSGLASSTSREYIIKRAVERMKEEMEFDQLGVLSITLPDGIKRTGAVTITLEDLLGEPAIVPKRSAFNVNFGTEQNTACEGNDPRLSDKRDPLEHKHEISEINGLEGILSTITGKIERVNGFLHEHKNKSVLDILVYTGNKSVIDLADLENIEEKIKKIVQDIENDITEYRNDIQTKVTQINAEIQTVRTEIESIKQYILDTNKQYFEQSKAYADTKINDAVTDIDNKLMDYTKKTELSPILDLASSVYTLVGSMEIPLSNAANLKEYDADISIAQDILNELNTRMQRLQDTQIELLLEYSDGSNLMRSNTPHVIIDDNAINGTLQAGIVFDNNTVHVSISCESNIPDYIINSKIILNIYSKKDVTI